MRTSNPTSSRTDSFREDFSAAAEGALPSGWTGDPSVGVRREHSFVWLQAAAQGMHVVRTPPARIEADFHLYLRCLLESWGELRLTLEGTNGSPDLVVTLRPSEATLTSATPQRAQLWSDYVNRVRLIRQNDVYRLVVNDRTLIAHRLPEHREFRRLAIGLTGPGHVASEAKLLEVELVPLASIDQAAHTKYQHAPGIRLGLRGVDWYLDTSRPRGIQVTLTDVGSPAARASLYYGDVITHVNGQRCTCWWQFNELLDCAKPRGSAVFTIDRQYGQRPGTYGATLAWGSRPAQGNR